MLNEVKNHLYWLVIQSPKVALFITIAMNTILHLPGEPTYNFIVGILLVTVL